MDLGDHVQMEHSKFAVMRKQQPDEYGRLEPYYSVNTMYQRVTYYNTEGRPDQAELEAKFAYSAWTDYKHY